MKRIAKNRKAVTVVEHDSSNGRLEISEQDRG